MKPNFGSPVRRFRESLGDKFHSPCDQLYEHMSSSKKLLSAISTLSQLAGKVVVSGIPNNLKCRQMRNGFELVDGTQAHDPRRFS